MINMTELYYFSPTGGTKKSGGIFCEGISQNVIMVDLGSRSNELKKVESDLAVFAAPVFGGRIPAIVVDKLNKLDGSGKKAVTLVVYGNRAYEDALLELNNVIEERGFQVVASAALVAQHSMAPEVGKGRPDEHDRKDILEFAGKVLEKIEHGKENLVKVPGNYPYKETMQMPVTPVSLSSCNQCNKCAAVCPTEAIQMKNNMVVTNPEKCILCMACVFACQEHARILPPPLQEKMAQKLGALKAVHGENEYFL